jgi:hypothetical protein
VRCFARPVVGPVYGLRLTRADHVPVVLGDRITRYDGPNGSLTVAWVVDVRSEHASRRALAMVGDLDTPRTPAALIDVDDDVRSYRELIANGQRSVVTTWTCREAVWAARYDGPAEFSLESALEVIRAAHCQ